MSKLSVMNLTTGYDKVNVLHDVSIEVEPGKITCILGSNGAGKSTLIRSILGLTPPRQGKIWWDERDLAGEKTHKIIASGIACIPEGRKVFPRMTVGENLALGAGLRDIPPPEGAVGAACGHDVGRRAGHGLDLPGPDGRTQAAAD